jgi:hypothetical protein
VTAQTIDEKPKYRTYYVEAPTEQEAIKKAKEKYIGDQVLMIAGKLSSNGFGLLASRFGDDGVLDAESVNLLYLELTSRLSWRPHVALRPRVGRCH